MGVSVVEACRHNHQGLTVRITETNVIVACTPASEPTPGSNALGWIGANLVLVDHQDIADLRNELNVIGVEKVRLRTM